MRHSLRPLLLTPILVVGLAACGGGERVSEVTLAQLAGAAGEFNGELVQTEGVVKRFDEDPERYHYWLEDEDVNRVAVEPHDEVSDRLGEHIRVVGRFSYHPEEGRLIEIDPAATAALDATP
ncbi:MULTISPECIES: hypothetical protein [unclassified Thioalkalivibrio]|uniref:hypothetical protein n=1 Tax=unclassified Thioalkalivibrio TaxID=2621013 RepID=UPI000195A4B7|nr:MULTISPECIES: hypothetical protein [unclassified Thioalkalivibrio]ADC72084.1 glucose-inhibited division protein B [Thioalkalivibrio sp. K90mix]